MKKYKVVIENSLYSDLEHIFNYIAKTLHARETAVSIFDKIVDAVYSLEEFPARNRLLATEPEREKGLRRLIVDNYSVIYYIKGETVIALRVFYNGADIVSRLRGEL